MFHVKPVGQCDGSSLPNTRCRLCVVLSSPPLRIDREDARRRWRGSTTNSSAMYASSTRGRPVLPRRPGRREGHYRYANIVGSVSRETTILQNACTRGRPHVSNSKDAPGRRASSRLRRSRSYRAGEAARPRTRANVSGCPDNNRHHQATVGDVDVSSSHANAGRAPAVGTRPVGQSADRFT